MINRHLGQRPISLAGYSLGARVIYYCLLELARVRAYGLVQDVFLFGTPVIIKQKECLRAQSVVAGRFVSGYKRNDWILGYLFRATSTGLGRVAGLGPIENCGDIENLDCTDLVGGHLLYRDAMPKLMKEAGFLVVSEEFSEMEDPDPDKHRERQIALYEEIEEAKRLVAQEEEDAIKSGKKIKRTRKSGFLGLWGKEIESKPAGLDGEGKKGPNLGRTSEPGEYDPYVEKGSYKNMKEKELSPTKPVQEDPNVLFDVDKMKEELAANGITITSLESTLPPLVVSSPTAAPPMHRASTTPVVTPVQRPHSPSLPVTMRGNVSTGDIDDGWVKPRDVTPERELEKLVIQTKTTNGPSLVPPKDKWDDDWEAGRSEITMTFEPESPKKARYSTLNEPYLHHSLSASSRALGEISEIKAVSSVLSLPIEKNVWDDDDYGSGGNITMSFE